MFTPQKNAFYFSGLIASVITIAIFAVIAAVLLAIFTSVSWLVVLPFAALLFLISVYFMSVRYKKTRLEFGNEHIQFFTGSPISDHQTTLTVKNITHVTLKKPFLEHLLFKTGTVIIESAGSSGQEVHARSLPNSEDVYKQLRELMKHNDFSLKKQTLLQEEKPIIAAVLVKELGAALLFIFFLGPAFIGSLIAAVAFSLWLLIPVALILSGIATALFLRIQDLLRRTYRVYDDVIEYEEGFLTKIDSIIPAENIADANNTQTFVDRIFGASNILVSCQGSGDIAFRYMPRGEELEKTIDKLAKAYTPLVGQAAGTRAHIHITPKSAKKTTSKPAVTGHYKMDVARSLVGAIAFAVPLLLIVGVVLAIFLVLDISWFSVIGFVPFILILIVFSAGNALLQAFITAYEVRERGVYKSVQFISRRTQEFTDDKLVGITYSQSIIDKLFDTATIQFLSLSSSPNISFTHIKHPHELIKQLREKYYLNTPVLHTHDARFSVVAYIKKNALFLIPLALSFALALAVFPRLATILLAILATVTLISYPFAVLRYKTSHLVLGKEHLEHRVGFFTTTTTIARYEDIKDVFATQYRYSSFGEIFVNVGGVSGQQENAQATQAIAATNGFTARYIHTPTERLDDIDAHILGRAPSSEVLKSAPSTLKNSALVWLLFPPFLPFRLWQVSRFRYTATPDRILKTRGVWNTQTQSITYSNFDHLKMAYGPTNKLFKNGSIRIFTIGSSAAEMTLFNVQDAAGWQQLLEKHYQ